jgi:ADP-ribose pyrophosphatase YjhB (NUDIX family)
MSIGWAESYLGQLRAVAGDRVLIFVGTRAVLRDERGWVALIRRSDNGEWALPAGALELGESVAQGAVREVREETGLTARALTPFAMYTGPAYTRTNMYGDTYQLHSTAFRVDEWSGELVRVTEETTDAGFFAVDALPAPLAGSVAETLTDLAAYEASGVFVVK